MIILTPTLPFVWNPLSSSLLFLPIQVFLRLQDLPQFYLRFWGFVFVLCWVVIGVLTISLVAALALEQLGSVVVAPGLSCPLARGILVAPPGIESMSAALEGEYLTTGSRRKSWFDFHFWNLPDHSSLCWSFLLCVFNESIGPWRGNTGLNFSSISLSSQHCVLKYGKLPVNTCQIKAQICLLVFYSFHIICLVFYLSWQDSMSVYNVSWTLWKDGCKKLVWDFPGSPGVKTPPSKAGDSGSTPGQGTDILHATGQLNSYATTKSPRAAMKPRHSQNKGKFKIK